MADDIRQAIVADIRRVASEMGTGELSRSEYVQRGEFTQYQIYDNGSTWGALCESAGIRSKTKLAVSDETYFRNLASAVETLGRYPLATERKRFGINVSKRRYANLSAFIDEAIELGYVPDLRAHTASAESDSDPVSPSSTVADLIKTALHKQGRTPRNAPPIPLNTRRKKWEGTGLAGFPYAPQEEQGVLALFAILCAEGILPWQILDISAGKGIDATCFDEVSQREIQVELKYLLSKGSWNHPLDDLDYVVCWESRWAGFPKPVIELSKVLRET